MDETNTDEIIETYQSETQIDSLLTTEKVCKILNTSITNLYALIDSGKIKAINIGRGEVRNNWRIRKSDLEDFLEKGTQNG